MRFHQKRLDQQRIQQPQAWANAIGWNPALISKATIDDQGEANKEYFAPVLGQIAMNMNREDWKGKDKSILNNQDV